MNIFEHILFFLRLWELFVSVGTGSISFGMFSGAFSVACFWFVRFLFIFTRRPQRPPRGYDGNVDVVERVLRSAAETNNKPQPGVCVGENGSKCLQIITNYYCS